MKSTNMDKLVDKLGRYMENGDYVYSPANEHYSFYIDVFFDELENGDCYHIDKFSDELAIRLIQQGLEPTGNDGGNKLDQHKRYLEFYQAWSNWCFIFRKLKAKGLLKSS